MFLVFSIFSFLFGTLIYGLLIKLAARLYRKSSVRYRQAFLFAAMVLLAGTVAAVLNIASGQFLGLVLGIGLSLAIQVSLGGWYLGPRALATSGEVVAFKGGMCIAAMAAVMFLVLTVSASVMFSLLLPPVATGG